MVGILLAVLTGTATAARWDRKGAQEALEKARALHEELTSASDFSKGDYLRCIQAYELVYLKDPHYSGSDDAIYQSAELYRLMGEKLQQPEYRSRAARQYRYLLSDYPRSPYCSEASQRLGQITEDTHKTSEGPAPPDAATPSKEVLSIRHWSTRDYTRVTIDLDGETAYAKTRISNPDRVFFDIKNTHVRPEWFNKHFTVEDDYLKQIRVAQNRTDVVRVVLDFSGATQYSVTELHDPFRIVIDLRGKRTAQPAAATTTAVGAEPSGERMAPLAVKAAAASREYAGQSEGSQVASGTHPTETAAATLSVVMMDLPASKPVRSGSRDAVLEPVSRSAPEEYGLVSATVSTELPVVPAAASRPTPSRKIMKSEPARDAKAADVPPAPVVSRDAGSATRPASPTSAGDRTMTRMLGLKVGRIVIDPGHGGHDTGTIGRSGLREKDLVLEVALRLRALIEENIGAEVVLTRETDVFIPLEERTAIANARQADLFISIHANSAKNRSTSGVETYFLNFAKTAAEREIAARENASAEQNIRDLPDLVRKIAQAEKSAESREFAAILQTRLHAGMRQVVPSTRNRGVRRAPFVVLIGANMPSVLTEVAFISNPRDEKLLKKPESRQHLAKSLLSGVEAYMLTLGSDVAQNRGNSK